MLKQQIEDSLRTIHSENACLAELHSRAESDLGHKVLASFLPRMVEALAQDDSTQSEVDGRSLARSLAS